MVNEGRTRECDVLIRHGRIEQIASNIAATDSDQLIEAKGRYLLPGMIDDQVHFREPGLTHKGDIATESAAAACRAACLISSRSIVDLIPVLGKGVLNVGLNRVANSSRHRRF